MQLTELFGRERSVITKHLRNNFKVGELAEESNVQNLHIANSGKPVKLFNLSTGFGLVNGRRMCCAM